MIVNMLAARKGRGGENSRLAEDAASWGCRLSRFVQDNRPYRRQRVTYPTRCRTAIMIYVCECSCPWTVDVSTSAEIACIPRTKFVASSFSSSMAFGLMPSSNTSFLICND